MGFVPTTEYRAYLVTCSCCGGPAGHYHLTVGRHQFGATTLDRSYKSKAITSREELETAVRAAEAHCQAPVKVMNRVLLAA